MPARVGMFNCLRMRRQENGAVMENNKLNNELQMMGTCVQLQ